MNAKSSPKFTESLALDAPNPLDAQVQARRLTTYSVKALRVASSIERIHVKYTGFANGLLALDRAFQLGTELSTPMGFRLVGPPGSGKTVLFQFFRDSLPRSSLFSDSMGAIGLRVPKRPLSGLFVRELLRQLKYPFAGGTHKQLYERRHLVFDALRAKGTRLVYLDEGHHLLTKHQTKSLESDEHEAIEFLREMIDVCRAALVIAGSSEIDGLKTVAPHLCSRVPGEEKLDLFKPNVEWLGFLSAFSKNAVDFNVGLIADRDFGVLMHMATDGNLRSFKQLIVESVLIAHDEGDEALKQETFKKAFQVVFGSGAARSNPFA
ncbi:TniB family NTP-binding protein [Acidovorax sp.]|uniref:TniB family NTP-binding protein n=1 Tax=Acidovorax sp. TaxID=1872122 RepID=UPI003D058914